MKPRDIFPKTHILLSFLLLDLLETPHGLKTVKRGIEASQTNLFLSSQAPSFPELEKTLDASIARLGGTVVPKLNWSCPKDTAWVSPSGSVNCNNGAEVLLLLKSSDVVVHDLCHAFDNCGDGGLTRPEQFVLVLKKWYPLRPEMEFRCFVKENRLRGKQRFLTCDVHLG